MVQSLQEILACRPPQRLLCAVSRAIGDVIVEPLPLLYLTHWPRSVATSLRLILGRLYGIPASPGFPGCARLVEVDGHINYMAPYCTAAASARNALGMNAVVMDNRGLSVAVHRRGHGSVPRRALIVCTPLQRNSIRHAGQGSSR
jgi:hypothetical protein